MIAWNTIEDALRGWVKTASGLNNAHVIWDQQTGARPQSNPFITMHLGDIVPVGGLDELSTSYDGGQSAGQEIGLDVTGIRKFHLTLQAFAPGVTSTNTARGLLSVVVTSLRLESVRAALAAVGISPFEIGTVQNMTLLLGTKFEGRAVCEIGFYVIESVTERTGYIATCTPQSYLGPPDHGTADDIDI